MKLPRQLAPILQLIALASLLGMCGCEQSADSTVSAGPAASSEVATASVPQSPVQPATTPAEASPVSPAQPVKIATHGTPSPGEIRKSDPPPRLSAPKDVTFDTIKFEMKKEDPFLRSMLTPQIEALASQPIRIRGYILPSFQQTGIKQFVLVRDNMQCCFGPGAALYDCIIVDMKPGKTAEYTVRPVTVTGVFAVSELLDEDGKHLAIYHLDGELVQ